jgi:hypothetical protein
MVAFFLEKIMQYNVGQVVYLLNQKTLSIIPTLVVEEIIRKTIEKETKQYVVELPDERNKRIILDNVSEIIFNDITKLREHMLDNTRKSVEKLINNALEKKEVFFGRSNVDLQSEIKSKIVKEKILSSSINTDTKQEIKKDDKKIIKDMQKNIKDVIIGNNNDVKTKEAK